MNIASKKNQEKLKAALQAHDIKPGNKQANGNSGSAQATKIVCIRPKRK
jgi:hypothetical protein